MHVGVTHTYICIYSNILNTIFYQHTIWKVNQTPKLDVPRHEQCPIFWWMHKAQGSLNFLLGAGRRLFANGTVDGSEILHYLGCKKPKNNGKNYQPHLGFLAGFLVTVNGALCLLLAVSQVPPTQGSTVQIFHLTEVIVSPWKRGAMMTSHVMNRLLIYIYIYIYMEYVSGKNIRWFCPPTPERCPRLP